MIQTFHKFRRLTGTFLLLLLIVTPFLRINGQSALRFDIPTLRLLFFGTEIWIADFFIVLIAFIFVTFLALFVTTMFGRIWCGWLCPQTVFLDAVDGRSRIAQNAAGRVAAELMLIAASFVIAGSLLGYFVSPYDMPALFAAGGTGSAIVQGSWALLTVLLFLDARLLGRKFCATACPYAKMQGVLFDERTLQVAYDARRKEECMGCEACVRACPVRIDIRQGLQMACIHCAECADACTSRMGVRGKKSLIGYSRGIPGVTASGIRINPVITGAIAGMSLVFLLYLAATRMPFDMSIRLASFGAGNRVVGQQEIMYDLSFRNMTGNDIPVDLSVAAAQGAASIQPQRILIRKGSDLTRARASIRITDGKPDSVTLTAQSSNNRISKNVPFPRFD